MEVVQGCQINLVPGLLHSAVQIFIVTVYEGFHTGEAPPETIATFIDA